MKVYATLIEAQRVLANKRLAKGEWFIEQTDNGWYVIVRREP